MHELQVLDDDAGLDDVALAVDQQRELAQRPAIYASPLAFECRPQAPAGQLRAIEVPKWSPLTCHSRRALDCFVASLSAL
jgi:hypothetical protein